MFGKGIYEDISFLDGVAGAAFGSLFAGIITIGANVLSGESVTKGLATSMLAGAASGALAATGVGIIGLIAGNAAISMAENGINQVLFINGIMTSNTSARVNNIKNLKG